MRWDSPVTSRDQLVLFAKRLNDVLAPDHAVRRLMELLEQIDFGEWELDYQVRGPGRPPFHPRLMAGLILYGLMVRIRSSRQLEEALQLRLDFRWLAEGRSIDHSTLCAFRQQNGERLKDLFVQIGLIAQEAGLLKLRELAFDGTKVRANNRRRGSRKVEQLLALKQELQQKFDQFTARADALDEQERLSTQATEELQDVKTRLQKISKAISEVERLEKAGEPVPPRIPLTDPQARITPNKEGGFSPNYTPLALVDVESGLIVSVDVIPDSNEKAQLPAAIDEVEEQFGVHPEAVLADGHFSDGPNLVAMEERNITLYSPVPLVKHNPALREDPTEPVPEEKWSELPTKKIEGKPQLDKQAFVFEKAEDCYRCPQGKRLSFRSISPEKRADGTIAERRRYQADPKDCGVCKLRSLCLRGKAKFRRISRDQFDPLRERLAERMRSEQAKKIYARRAAVGERPFAVIKTVMGVRQFLTRGLERVQTEWRWIAAAFNVMKLLNQQPTRAGPAPSSPS